MNNEQLSILFGSRTRVKLLRHFLGEPDGKFYVRELTRLLADHINAIRHELGNLEKAELVTKKQAQGKLYYRLNQETAGIKELKQLFAPPAPAPVAETVLEPGAAAFSGVQVPPRDTSPPAPELGDVRLLVQNGKFVGSKEAPADILLVGDIDDALFKAYIAEMESTHGEIRYSVMSETEFTYRHQLFDRFITLMLGEPKKVVVNGLRDRQLVRR